MSKTALPIPVNFSNLLKEVKARIQESQTRAVLSVNAELEEIEATLAESDEIENTSPKAKKPKPSKPARSGVERKPNKRPKTKK